MQITIRKTLNFLFLIIVSICFSNISALAQPVGFNAAQPESSDNSTSVECVFLTGPVERKLASTGFAFDSSQSAQKVTDEVLAAAKWSGTVWAKSAEVPNAEICPSNNGVFYILYSPKWFKALYQDTEEEWADRGIIAHELGHFAHTHYLKYLESNPKIELEADEYAGEILAKMGANLAQAKTAFESAKMKSGSHGNHPPTEQRLAAVERGWRKINPEFVSNQTKPTNLQQVRLFLDQGKKFESEKLFEKAAAEYTKAINLEPNLAEAYKNRGWAYYKQNKFDLAIADYSKAIEKDTSYASAYNLRGVAYRRVTKYELALADFNKVITLDRNHIFVYNNRGNIYDDMDKLTLALADYSKVVELDPKFVAGYHNRGNILERMGKLDLALRDYTKAIELNPKYIYAYRNRSGVYRQLGKIDLAEADEKMEQALSNSQVK